MKQIEQKDFDYAALVLRITLGIFFVIAGFSQVLHISGFANTVSGFGIVSEVPSGIASLAAALVPWVEIILGIMLFFGLATSVVALIVAFVSFVFAAANGFVTPGSIAKEIMFVAVALALMLMGGGGMSVDAHLKDKWSKKK